MKGSSTVNPATETFGQARQGSVAAIIQVLNERLADSGIRTRAMVADGILQLLCEADTPDKLEQTATVERVRHELETISPQRIKRVKINSRIVKEAQLLWLEEINKDPENALLWAQTITLKRPFFLKRWFRDRHLKPAGPLLKDITDPEPSQSTLTSKVIGALGIAALLLGTVWFFRSDLSTLQQAEQPSEPAEQPNELAGNEQDAGDRTADLTPPAPNSATPPADATSPAAATSTASNPSASNSSTSNPSTPDSPGESASSTGNASDAFAQAVRVANQAAVDGQNASTAAEWLDLAARWQTASDLMKNVPVDNEQYAVAQDRTTTYQQNSQAALQEAAALQNQ